jgi:PadR family transcriptional regulator AphA
MARSDPTLAREVVLALVVAEPRHGWALQRELSPEGRIGRAWSLSRQLTYRALDAIVEDGLARRSSPRDGGGADRVTVTATAPGRRHSRDWLDEPVSHLRDVRTELLVKLMLREQLGMDTAAFLTRQRTVFDPLIERLRENEDTGVVATWRRENADAVRRFLDSLERQTTA